MKALLIVDMQNDFMPWGALPVKNADKLIPAVNSLMPLFNLVIATQDWHPANHKSFAINNSGKQVGDIITLNGIEQYLWPEHCIQNTSGASFVQGLNTDRLDAIIQKGTDPAIDSYSGFFDNAHQKSTNLADLLKMKKMGSLHICGVATDYCVKYTALDAISLGFETTVIQDACKGVNVKKHDSSNALKTMAQHHVRLKLVADYHHKK